jgi:hypothetical protein
MGAPVLPRYPVYVPSKGRPDCCLTARELARDGVPFRLVVEPQEFDLYAARFGADRVCSLPFRDRGCVVPARNWIKDHAAAAGAARHWQLDDNMKGFYRRWKGQRLHCRSGIALAVVEDFADRYENVAVAGMNYNMFAPEGQVYPPFWLNCHVYSCMLLLTGLPNRWRGRYNEDTDYCLQVLADGWCTVLVNAFLAKKVWTMQMKGGNTDALYRGDGRLKMARELERRWPHVVTTRRRFRRPQHVIRNQWRGFTTPLRLRPGLDLAVLPPNEYGMELVQVQPIKSESLRRLVQPRLVDRPVVPEMPGG